MQDNTVDDWRSRVSIARREANDFHRILVVGYWTCPIVAGAVIATAHWLFSASLPVLLLISTCLVLLGIGMMIAEAAHRHYIQCAFVEMTVAHLESEIERMHDKLDGIALNAERAAASSTTRYSAI